MALRAGHHCDVDAAATIASLYALADGGTTTEP